MTKRDNSGKATKANPATKTTGPAESLPRERPSCRYAIPLVNAINRSFAHNGATRRFGRRKTGLTHAQSIAS
jgi:hypothetical protein